MRRSRRAVVVGGGVFGLTAGLELRSRGWSVTLVEAGDLPAGWASSTDVSKMVRMDYGSDRFFTELADMALSGWDAWNRRWERTLFHECGFLLLSREALAPGGFEYESRETLSALGHGVETLDARAIERRFPAWVAERWPHGYFNSRGGWAESGEVVRRLAWDARRAGVRILTGVTVLGLLQRGSRVIGVHAEGRESLLGDTVVVAAGAWTSSVVPELVGALEPVGQPVLHFRPESSSQWESPQLVPWGADIAKTGWYGFPRTSEGILKVGHHGRGLGIPVGRDSEVPPAHVSRCRSFLTESLPDLADVPLQASRVCYYCDSFDGYFWIDRDPDRRGLVVAAGGSGHGFKFAPLLGPLVADAVEGRRTRWGDPFRWRPFEGAVRVEDARYVGE